MSFIKLLVEINHIFLTHCYFAFEIVNIIKLSYNPKFLDEFHEVKELETAFFCVN